VTYSSPVCVVRLQLQHPICLVRAYLQQSRRAKLTKTARTAPANALFSIRETRVLNFQANSRPNLLMTFFSESSQWIVSEILAPPFGATAPMIVSRVRGLKNENDYEKSYYRRKEESK